MKRHAGNCYYSDPEHPAHMPAYYTAPRVTAEAGTTAIAVGIQYGERAAQAAIASTAQPVSSRLQIPEAEIMEAVRQAVAPVILGWGRGEDAALTQRCVEMACIVAEDYARALWRQAPAPPIVESVRESSTARAGPAWMTHAERMRELDRKD